MQRDYHNIGLLSNHSNAIWLLSRGILMHKKSLLIQIIILILMLMVPSCILKSDQYYDNGTSDEEYISIAREQEDVRIFLERYPQAEMAVDRSGRLAVDFKVTTISVISTTQNWEGIRLRIFLDPKTNQPTGSLFQCNNKVIENEVHKYLGNYLETQECQ
jgi:hypothetical protein